jgi:hypothetical protein
MTPKSGKRFSEKVMHKRKARACSAGVDPTLDPLIPAKAGIQGSLHEDWVPASAGTNGETDST